jgi:ABC-type sugar transport system ATPase subunit
MMAGLEDTTSGAIRIDGEGCNDRAPKERGIAMVFQSYALYPHKTVYQNMAFSLKLSRRPKAESSVAPTWAAFMKTTRWTGEPATDSP